MSRQGLRQSPGRTHGQGLEPPESRGHIILPQNPCETGGGGAGNSTQEQVASPTCGQEEMSQDGDALSKRQILQPHGGTPPVTPTPARLLAMSPPAAVVPAPPPPPFQAYLKCQPPPPCPVRPFGLFAVTSSGPDFTGRAGSP